MASLNTQKSSPSSAISRLSTQLLCMSRTMLLNSPCSEAAHCSEDHGEAAMSCGDLSGEFRSANFLLPGFRGVDCMWIMASENESSSFADMPLNLLGGDPHNAMVSAGFRKPQFRVCLGRSLRFWGSAARRASRPKETRSESEWCFRVRLSGVPIPFAPSSLFPLNTRMLRGPTGRSWLVELLRLDRCGDAEPECLDFVGDGVRPDEDVLDACEECFAALSNGTAQCNRRPLSLLGDAIGASAWRAAGRPGSPGAAPLSTVSRAMSAWLRPPAPPA
mmetsp:Transcript_118117/g.335055  ORF Transcript_118117/g.335055 Transcript_118117/m.335055 type:complete len:276 (-) Transcript_118117:202-1029(-)